MPTYDFRCKQCKTEFAVFYKTLKAYEASITHCPSCDATDLARVINKINLEAPSRDYRKMSSAEMLSVFSSGDSKQVGQMFSQVAGSHPAMATDYHEATQRLLKGESMDKVENHLRERDSEKTTSTPPPAPATPSE
jgi:putative FmdB family regulatory protein